MRKGLRPAAGIAALVLAATACGGGSGEDEVVELRFSWWGADDRHATTQEVIERFEQAHPNIRVEGEYTDWESYWDRLATNTAANDAPDIITQEERYLREYADRGALLDLNEVGEQLDTSQLDELVMPGGELDGGLFGVPTGVNAFTIMADPQAFEEAGVEMPDDENWTWEEYVETAVAISEGSDGEIIGSQTPAFNEQSFQIFARQRGEQLYDENGELAFDAATMTEYWELMQRLHEEGGAPGAAESVEYESGGPDLSVLATNEGAMAAFWTNQLGAMAETAGRDLELLRFPGEAESEQAGTFFKPAMFYSISAETEHPEEAALFVDYLLNDREAAELILADRGLPANTEVREQIRDQLPEADQLGADFLDEIEPDVAGAVPPPPIGAGEVVDITKRINEDLMFGEISPEEAAEQWISEVETATGDE
ncbi:ABC transporter substrate-binding protein [Streptomonospora nanhaiensis]|uniref:Multiple sugar transport system substrate-binding protein n=1 Tax=Streptomonospora nanhaiensis TaxID=1323731 RepID=A0A853BXN1_9ACTN|nr:ABC transporter substrate-binding protein [Streptomonospora nanhaiensis]MBV2365584.1 ABC transporter substrate-binding protein [Streptomonospora nanhaiensis]MBX9387138.1 ABC transporter substrate-binding protein [Streptomonospora nanhaiensis]NYI98922.1 multiple sugar transport system substrate-binding protein [Streptomonospora nanhaiensis]